MAPLAPLWKRTLFGMSVKRTAIVDIPQGPNVDEPAPPPQQEDPLPTLDEPPRGVPIYKLPNAEVHRVKRNSTLPDRGRRHKYRPECRRDGPRTRNHGSMLTAGDIVELDLGVPAGSEAGLRRPAIVVTAGRILMGEPSVIQVVPLTRTIRHSSVEVVIDPDEGNVLDERSSAQCQHVRSVATTRIHRRGGNVGSVILGEVRETLAVLMDL